MKEVFSKRDIKPKANGYKTQLESWKVRYIFQKKKIVCMMNPRLKMVEERIRKFVNRTEDFIQNKTFRNNVASGCVFFKYKILDTRHGKYMIVSNLYLLNAAKNGNL